MSSSRSIMDQENHVQYLRRKLIEANQEMERAGQKLSSISERLARAEVKLSQMEGGRMLEDESPDVNPLYRVYADGSLEDYRD